MITVRAHDLRRSYQSEGRRVDVLQGVSVELAAGEVTALVGRSGSGKSTLLNILGTIATADSGRLEIQGIDVSTLDSKGRADLRSRHIGFVFQSFNLLAHLSARQNVALPFRGGVRAGAIQAERLLERVGLADRASHRPGELSAGEQQRVAVARALVNDPSIVLADEPTGNLDSATESHLLDLFREMATDGRSVLLVTHSDSVAASADRVLRMHASEIVTEAVRA